MEHTSRGFATDFTDRSGKVLYFGDFVQYRLNNLRQGASLRQVVRGKGGRVLLVDPHHPKERGLPMSNSYKQYVTIVDTSGRKDYLN